MSDFFQNGVISTFHKLGTQNLKELEKNLKGFTSIRPIGLVLPSLYREFASGALQNIMKILKNVHYLKEIVLCLDDAGVKQFKKVKSYFSSYKNFRVIWNDGPKMKELYKLLEENDLPPGERGKEVHWIVYLFSALFIIRYILK